MDPKHFLRQLLRLAKACGTPLYLSLAFAFALAGVALYQGRSVELSFSLFHGLRFSAQSPITAPALAAAQHPPNSPASREK